MCWRDGASRRPDYLIPVQGIKATDMRGNASQVEELEGIDHRSPIALKGRLRPALAGSNR